MEAGGDGGGRRGWRAAMEASSGILAASHGPSQVFSDQVAGLSLVQEAQEVREVSWACSALDPLQNSQ